MAQYPPEVQSMHDALMVLEGVQAVELGLIDLADVDVESLAEPGLYADLPQVAIRRTDGGRQDEKLLTMKLQFSADAAGWVALEFLAWWIRDLAREGRDIQMRSLALPPLEASVQLGTTLKHVVELFFVDPDESTDGLMREIADLAESLQECLDLYADALASPAGPAKLGEHSGQTSHEHGDDDGHHHCHHDMNELRAEAESGDPGAMFHLAQHLENGDQGAADPQGAFELYSRAAELEFPPAQLFLGRCYEQGIGVAADPHQAVKLYRQAAVEEFPLAMGFVGQCYENGIGVPIDLVAAAKWYRQGAQLEEPGCQAQLGECYEFGKGVERNAREALRWYLAAQTQGLDDVNEAIARTKAQLQ